MIINKNGLIEETKNIEGLGLANSLLKLQEDR